ncbi:DNA helicase-2/ATP-dependent DNA helicase PcrA [Streptomyces sp. SAI-135]|uniref:UvrD-helicase domain-containing protein n=1 Tax=unclassified Streptomyces TaxID=2593676 RepID=UPI002473071B|nr:MULTISPECIES: ATP-dependent helicase [unclassified Streptomyces]MDH6521842.1 DNA helicase-2/ATP-dependent DNA helicase PcrA [Streptomyces sp. SAI-090]MDH6573208.1 DNA helicase-2/ATP-dependent DNA helicase PcrA [Streptomyces sp. SAI-117]MDH6614057.1 DNA helicase-2/ATP-dependent DNA helicase PcrA [Streptomyces sp. SAI-135]
MSALRPSPSAARTQLMPAHEWRPTGIEDLEPAAWAALRGTGNAAVIAGPGAGKTEFLAQRAAYLLQTGLCPWPQRILAISYKKDAAANLGRRVGARVPEHASRFVSMTFDAFTKSLVDRFAAALPAPWRMSDGYVITPAFDAEVSNFLNGVAYSAPPALRWQVAGLQPNRFMADAVGGWSLPESLPSDDSVDGAVYAVHEWWRQHYLRPGTARLEFVMLNRLAELLIRTAPKLRRALRMTYPIVFVDEFQDTTSAQFSFLVSAFGERTTVTAVGDTKQRIMEWAGALPEALTRFTDTFDATTYQLAWNFRSSDALVELQHVIASKLDPDTVRATSKAPPAEEEHQPALLWTFSSADWEATFIADWIARDIAGSDRTPSDFALIARQTIRNFEQLYRDRLAAHGIRVRNDDAPVGKLKLQDLVKNEVARLLLGLLRLAEQPLGLAGVWREVSAAMERVHGATDDEGAQRRVGEALAQLTTQLRGWLQAHPPASAPASDVVQELVRLVGSDTLRGYVKSTATGDDFDIVIDAFEARLEAVTDGAADWGQALDEFESSNAVVLLTAHRSKGLEYHTVFFLGIHDRQWWPFSRDPREGTSTFFVGLSRAAQRLIFTTDHSDRTGPIAPLFTMLAEAGVPETDQG